MLRKFLFIFILVIISSKAFPAHIIGGEMYYRCLGDNLYQFTMKLYRDCNSNGAAFDDPANFAVFDENNNLILTKQDFINSITFVQPDLDSPCLAFPPDICVQEGLYVFSIQLPSDSQAYKVVYQRCCRNATIQNLTNPGDQGLTIETTIPAASDAPCNSAPSYNNFPPPVLCAQEYLEFDHSATDSDGDSLAYKLCSPFIGGSTNNPAPDPPSNPPYSTVDWGPGFNEINPVNGSPGLSIDPITGMLSGTPTQLGQYVVGVCVEEWRDGVLLNVNTRDFQFNVALCEQLFTASIADPDPGDFCDDLIFQFENESNPDNQFIWHFGDPTTDDDVSELYSPSYTYPDTGTYEVMLITNPGFFCSDTAFLTVPLYYDIAINVEIASFECINGQQVFTFAADGVFEDDAQINWDFGPDATPQFGAGTSISGVTFVNIGDQNIGVEVIDNICDAQDEVTVNIPEPPELTITPQNLFCNGLNYQFTQENENATFFTWDFGVEGVDTDVSSQASAGFTYPEAGIYTISLTGNNGDNCPITVTEEFDIQTLLEPEIAPTTITCLEGNSVNFEASGSFSNDAVFMWEFQAANPGTSAMQNPTGISFESAGTHPVGLTISENGCTRSANAEMTIHSNPIADFVAQSAYGCAPLTVSFTDQSFTQSSSVSYLYNFGDGESSSARNTKHIYTEPGIYSVQFFIENLNGCIDSDNAFKEGLVEVVPTPVAGFIADPLIVSAINPVIEITDISEGSSSCQYIFDGQVFDDCNFEYSLQNVEPQTITQTVENEFGCKATIETEIKISDHLIYVPNAFTPDQDGLNDFFFPVTTGAVNIEMHVFDRWGQEIYRNMNDTQGWNGSSHTEDYYAPADVYQYIIIITDNLNWNFEYTGSVRLLR